jgi:hypothetical protein
MTTFRTVVSSVAKVCSLQNITFTHGIHQCRFPTLVYPTRATRTIAPRLPLRSHLFVDCFDFIFQ